MKCEGCFFWESGVVGGDKDKGMCHRYPNWFVTPRDYWCGEFETKERVVEPPQTLGTATWKSGPQQGGRKGKR